MELVVLQNLRAKANELQKYVEASNDSLCEVLIEIVDSLSCASEEFIIALDKEITEQLTNYKENATIVEREEVFTRVIVELDEKRLI